MLVIVPDSQLSLAIGKRGQNARLAAKLTGLRVDIKSESEVEEERRRAEEELAEGRETLSTIAGVGPQLFERLVEAELFSPVRIVRAGPAALEAVPGLAPEQAARLFDAAQSWVSEHSAAMQTAERDLEFPADRGESRDAEAEPSSGSEPPHLAGERAPVE